MGEETSKRSEENNHGIQILIQAVESALRTAHRSGGRITEAEANAVWHGDALEKARSLAHLPAGELGAARRFYDHLVAKANAEGEMRPHYPAVAEAHCCAHMHAQSAILPQHHAALQNGHISDRERADLAAAYQAQLDASIPAPVRRALVKHQLDLMDFENMRMSYQQSELCLYGPESLKRQVKTSAEHIRQHP